ncbi:hypothetical protein Avbf_07270 [Armadillidium vulgare]|nr:hypothetical protein Avbf_07270 [Armadillidium vulgare]
MPGSSVSACHMCHLHSHNQDNLLKTSPLRNSRCRSRSSSKHRNHHGHSNSGYSTTRDEVSRVARSNSSSALARLTDNSHSLPGSRTNSLSRYHREVSIMPDGGDTYGRVMRSSSSTRSLDTNPPMTILDARTTSLPRISTLLHSHPQIHAQPDIIVNALPRSRAESRTGSLTRNAVNLSQDNSHDYYLDIHRQRFKDEKRKHRFNLQTVMLIGCYTLLMIAIVVSVVLCYQNGWLGLGPPKEKISRNVLRFNNSHSSQGSSVDFRNRRKKDRTNERIALDGQSVRTRQRNKNNIDHSNTLHPGNMQTGFDNNGNSIHQMIPQRTEDQLNQRNIRPQLNVGNSFDNTQLRNNQQNMNQNILHMQPTGIPLRPTDENAHLVNENQRFLTPTHTANRQPAHTLQVHDSFLQNKQPFDNKPDSSNFAAGAPLNINPQNKFIIRRPTGELFSDQPHSEKPLVRTGNLDTNTIAKTLHQAGFPLINQAPVQVRDGISGTEAVPSNRQFTVSLKPKVESSSQDLSSIPVRNKVLTSDSETLTTQQLIDLLAIRRMRDLLNSQVNAQSVLDILRKVEPSQDTRLELIRKESVNPAETENNLRLLRAQGRSIQDPLSDISNDNQVGKLLEALIKKEDSAKKGEQNIEGSATENFQTNMSIDTISSNINSLINSTINGAIIRLLNKKSSVSSEGPDVDVDISGVSVFPLSSRDLRILLESNPSNIHENIGPLTSEKLRSLQILHRLIELNTLKQKVQSHVEDALNFRNTEKDVSNSKVKPKSRRQPKDSVIEERISERKTSSRSHPIVPDPSVVTRVPLHNVTTSFNRGSTLSIDEAKDTPLEPDPSFAVLVRTDGQRRPIQNKRTVSRSPHVARNPIITERQRKIERQVPVQESVAVQPGRGRLRTNSAVIRAWTHMDREGTLSKGRIHSDGSFTFTNCRPVEICKSKNVNRPVSGNSENSAIKK